MPRIALNAPEVVEAMLVGCHDAFCDSGASFSCTEIELIVEVYRAFGHEDWVEAILEGHAAEDDEGDDHYGWYLRREAEWAEAQGQTTQAAKLYEQADDWEREMAEGAI